jgi:Sap, sulfolipid-1-addressing protein
VWEIFVLAVLASFWPALIAVALVALASPRPIPMLGFFLAGGLLTTTAIGLAIAFSLSGSSAFTGSRPPAPPAVNITAGILALIVAVVASRREGTQPVPKTLDTKPWTERMLAGGTGRIAFLVGIVINLVPGLAAVVGYTNIARLDYGTAATIALVVAFNVIMFALIEVPLLGYALAPGPTTARVTSLNSWLKSHGRRAIVVTAAAVGIYLIARGILQLVD